MLPLLTDPKNLIRRSSWEFPSIYRKLYQKRWSGAFIPDKFDVYVSGFPRSGNNFLLENCRLLLSDKHSVSGASHLPPLMIQSCQDERPTLMTLRDPLASCASWVTAVGCSASHALRYNIIFHKFLISKKPNNLILVKFDDLVSKSDEFTSKLADYLRSYDLEVTENILSAEDMESKVFNKIKGEASEASPILTVPSEKRAALKADAKVALADPGLESLRQEAVEIFEECSATFSCI